MKTALKISAVILAFVTAISFTACSKPTESEVETTKQEKKTTTLPFANISAQDLEPGNTDGDIKSDLWYEKDKKDSTQYIYFTKAESESGLSVTIISTDSENTYMLKETDEKHLIPENKSDYGKCEFLIIDDFTAYEAVTETWYSRGNKAEYVKKLAGKSFVCENEKDDVVTLNANGTLTEIYGDDDYTGSWEIKSPTTIKIIFEGEEYSGICYLIKYSPDGELKGITIEKELYLLKTKGKA